MFSEPLMLRNILFQDVMDQVSKLQFSVVGRTNSQNNLLQSFKRDTGGKLGVCCQA